MAARRASRLTGVGVLTRAIERSRKCGSVSWPDALELGVVLGAGDDAGVGRCSSAEMRSARRSVSLRSAVVVSSSREVRACSLSCRELVDARQGLVLAGSDCRHDVAQGGLVLVVHGGGVGR